MNAEVAGKAGEEREAAAAEAAAREALRAVEAAASAAAAAVVEAQREVTEAEDAHRAAVVERRALEAEADHLRAALRDMEDVGGEVLEVAGEFPGTVSLAGSVSCEAGYERALAAALAQLSGALAVPGGVDQWSLLDALKRAGIGLVRLVVPARRRPPVAFPGAAPLADKVSFGEHEGLEGALADVVIVDDLRAVPAEFTGPRGHPRGRVLPAGRRPDRPGERRPGGAAPGAPGVAGAAGGEAGRGRRARGARGGRRHAGEAAARRGARGRGGGVRGRARGAHRRRDGRARPRRRSGRAAATSRITCSATGGAWRASPPSSPRRPRPRRPPTRPRPRALLQTEQLRPAGADADTALHEAEARPLRRRWRWSRGGASSSRSAALRRRGRRNVCEAARKRVAADRERLEELDRRLAEIPAVREACTTVETRTGALRAHSTRLIAQLDVGDDEGAGLERGELRKLAEDESQLRRELEQAGERRTEVQVALARLDDRRNELAAGLDEVSEQLDQAGFAPPADEAEEAQLRERVERLSRRRERIGPVNPLAEAECAELSERAAFLREQRRDLEKSIDDLEALIKELTAQVDEEFAATFSAVQEQFSHMVTVLFPGGRGSLKLVEPGRRAPAGRRGRGGQAGQEARQAPAAALRRRARAGGHRLPHGAGAGAAVAVLHPRRDRGGPGRRQHRPPGAAAARLQGAHAVRDHHAPEADHGGRRRALRGDDGAGRGIPGGERPDGGGRDRA